RLRVPPRPRHAGDDQRRDGDACLVRHRRDRRRRRQGARRSPLGRADPGPPRARGAERRARGPHHPRWLQPGRGHGPARRDALPARSARDHGAERLRTARAAPRARGDHRQPGDADAVLPRPRRSGGPDRRRPHGLRGARAPGPPRGMARVAHGPRGLAERADGHPAVARRPVRPDGMKKPAERSAHTEATRDPRQPLSADPASLGSGRFLALYEIGQQLLQQREPAEVLRTIHEAIVRHLQPDRAALLAVAADGSYRPLFAHELDLSPPPEQWPVSGTVIRQVLDGGLAVLASDVRGNPQLEDAESIQRFRIRSVMCVPLGEPVRGLIYLDNRSARPFTAADLEFLTAAARYASLVLKSAEEHLRTTEALALSGERLEMLQGELLRHEIVGAAPSLLRAYDALRRLAR